MRVLENDEVVLQILKVTQINENLQKKMLFIKLEILRSLYYSLVTAVIFNPSVLRYIGENQIRKMVTENRKRYLLVCSVPDLLQIFLNFWGHSQLENRRTLPCVEMFFNIFQEFLMHSH